MKLVEEPENKAVITTKCVMKNGSVITYISLDEDGDWQLFGDEDVTEKDAFIVSIEQILEIDNTLKNIPDIQRGQSVSRVNLNSPWQVKE